MDGKKIVRDGFGIAYEVDESLDWDNMTSDEQDVAIILGDAVEVA